VEVGTAHFGAFFFCRFFGRPATYIDVLWQARRPWPKRRRFPRRMFPIFDACGRGRVNWTSVIRLFAPNWNVRRVSYHDYRIARYYVHAFRCANRFPPFAGSRRRHHTGRVRANSYEPGIGFTGLTPSHDTANRSTNRARRRSTLLMCMCWPKQLQPGIYLPLPQGVLTPWNFWQSCNIGTHWGC